MHCIARPATAPSDTPSFPGRRLGTCIQGRTPKASQGKRAAEVAQAVPGLAAMDWVGWGRRTQCRDGRTRIPGNKTQRGPRDSRPARGPEPQSEYWGAGTSAVGPDLPPRSVPGRCAAPASPGTHPGAGPPRSTPALSAAAPRLRGLRWAAVEAQPRRGSRSLLLSASCPGAAPQPQPSPASPAGRPAKSWERCGPPRPARPTCSGGRGWPP